jgi:hypothetical protein
MALLYRPLVSYPPLELEIFEIGAFTSPPGLRLPGVRYSPHPLAGRWLLRSRVAHAYASLCHVAAPARATRLAADLDRFGPEAILTVAHGYGWLTAARVARRRGLPLHLVVHDRAAAGAGLPAWLVPRAEDQLAAVYRGAASRMCVSPYMADYYTRRFEARGTVVYPVRGVDVPEYMAPPELADSTPPTLRFAHAGAVQGPAYARALGDLAAVLRALGGTLDLYTPRADEAVEQLARDHPNVRDHGTIPAADLVPRIRESQDALFLPMSFAAEHRLDVELSFPSKLADYTATGLPILVWGPPYCSAARWGRDFSGVCEIVDQPGLEDLSRSVSALARDPVHRRSLGGCALEVGRRLFSYSVVTGTFLDILATSRPACTPPLGPGAGSG